MKNTFFALSLFVGVGVLALYIFFANSQSSKVTISQENSIENILGFKSGSGAQVKIFDIAVGDQILMSTGSEEPKRDPASSSRISLGEGLYLLALDNSFSEVEIETDTMQISHLAKGIYIINTMEKKSAIYSLTSLLRVGLKDTSKEGTNITEFTLFPTQYFLLNTQTPITEMRGADVFRLAQINTLGTNLPETDGAFTRIFADESVAAKSLFDSYSSLRKERVGKLKDLSDDFVMSDNSEVGFFEKYGPIFVNPAKKQILYRNILIKRLQSLYKLSQNTCADTTCKKESIAFLGQVAEIKKVIDSIGALSEIEGKNAQALVSQYSILISFAAPTRDDKYSDLIFKNLATISDASNNGSISTGYLPIRNLYTRYIFDGQTEQAHTLELQKYIDFMVNSGFLASKDFLGFVYFLGDALQGKKITQAPSISLFRLLLKIADSHINTLTDPAQKQIILSVFYYTFTGITDNLQLSLTREFFTNTDLNNTELKREFLNGATANIDSTLLGNLESLKIQYQTFDSSYGADFEKSLPMALEGSLNSRLLTNNAFNELNRIDKIISDYAGYRTQISLGTNAKSATGLEALKEPLSLVALTTYLSKFNGVDPATISVVNDISVDTYYDTRVRINGKNFSFKFTPIGNTIERVIIEENGVTNTQFERIKQSIDEREKVLSELKSNVTDINDRIRYDIKNYFVSTFSDFISPVVTQNPTPVISTGMDLSPQMKLFIQSNLIEKDFLLVKESLSIPIQSVFASIENGAYKISITNATSTLSDGNRIYSLLVDSKYIFTQDTHAFQDVSFTVKNDQGISMFGGVRINLLPAIIDNRAFNTTWKEILPYLLKLGQLGGTASTIAIDLTNKILIVDGNTLNL